MRLALGSATVSAITAAGLILPIIAGCGVRPDLMVLATGSGSLMFSHFNDIGFWMFKEYYNVGIRHTFLIWTVMESIVAVVGLAGVSALHIIMGESMGTLALLLMVLACVQARERRVFYVNSYHPGYGSGDEFKAGIGGTLAAVS